MNRGEANHGSQSEEIEIKEEGQEGRGEKEIGCEALRAEEEVRCKEKEDCAEESAGEKEIRSEENRGTKTR
jgi:hypothetical protein